MNEQLQEQAGEILELLKVGIEKGGAFAGEQLPDVARQLILFRRAACSMWLAIGIAALIGGIWLFRAISKWQRDNEVCDDCGLITMPAIISLFGFLAVVCSGTGLLKLWLAPKLYLLEYIGKIMK